MISTFSFSTFSALQPRIYFAFMALILLLYGHQYYEWLTAEDGFVEVRNSNHCMDRRYQADKRNHIFPCEAALQSRSLLLHKQLYSLSTSQPKPLYLTFSHNNHSPSS